MVVIVTLSYVINGAICVVILLTALKLLQFKMSGAHKFVLNGLSVFLVVLLMFGLIASSVLK